MKDDVGTWQQIARARSKLANDLVRREADRGSTLAHDLRGFVQIVKLGTAELARRAVTPVNDGFDLIGELQQTAERVKTTPIEVLGEPAIVAEAIAPAVAALREVLPQLEIDVSNAPARFSTCSAPELCELLYALALDPPARAKALAVEPFHDVDHDYEGVRLRAHYDGAVQEDDLSIAGVIARRADGSLVISPAGVVIRLPLK